MKINYLKPFKNIDMILGFKKQFIDKIKDGSKIHTIREDKKGRWKKGNQVHFTANIRTRDQYQFHYGHCISTQSIEIQYEYPNNPDYYPNVFIDGKLMDSDGIYILATLDGFESIADFFQWFNTDFKGKIIHWTNYKY